MAQTVEYGPFGGNTKAGLDAIRTAFVADTPTYTRDLAGAGVNGQSFTFTHSGVEYTREQFWELLKHAYNQVGETKYGYPAGDHTAARF